MNEDVATAAAYTQDDLTWMRADKILTAFDRDLEAIRNQYRLAPDEVALLAVKFIKSVHRIRARDMHIRIARLAAHCAAAGVR